MTRLAERLLALAAARPDHIAVNDGTPCTWREIVSTAPDLSQFRGGIAVVLHRKNRHWISALLACLRDGVVFCPLDPDGAPERIAHILTRADPNVIVGETGVIVRRGVGIPVAGAYLVFTSGSTGRPKGVLVGEDGVHNVIDAQIELFGAREARFAWLLNPGFDASLSDVFCALLGGGTLCIPQFPITRTKRLAALFQELGVTHADIPPRMLQVLSPDDFPTLRAVVAGGEPIQHDMVARWGGRARLYNAYGPTEATICTNAVEVFPSWDKAWLGDWLPGVRGMASTDEGLVPPDQLGGGYGELWLCGPNLALGYFRDDDLNRARFPTMDGIRYFRTGDMVGMGEHGLFWAGRTDRQVKINGCLVCPEEIERHLSAICPNSVVTVSEGDIVACVEQNVSLSAIRDFLKPLVPSYMLPNRVRVLDAIPVNAHGKADLAKL